MGNAEVIGRAAMESKVESGGSSLSEKRRRTSNGNKRRKLHGSGQRCARPTSRRPPDGMPGCKRPRRRSGDYGRTRWRTPERSRRIRIAAQSARRWARYGRRLLRGGCRRCHPFPGALVPAPKWTTTQRGVLSALSIIPYPAGDWSNLQRPPEGRMGKEGKKPNLRNFAASPLPIFVGGRSLLYDTIRSIGTRTKWKRTQSR